MSNWLNSVRAALDNSAQPIRLFFRDDDAGWANDRLLALLDIFGQVGMPIDCAVIPEILDQTLSHELLCRWQQAKQFIGLHQHGYSHSNHEPPESRKNEFGSNRNKDQQKSDIAAGQAFLHDILGDALDPIFTPPWNRCTQATVDCLEELDFKLLSRDISAVKLDTVNVKQVPIHLDWSKVLKTSSNPLPMLSQSIANHLHNNTLTGIMLHHADMNTENLQPLTELLSVLASHQQVQSLLLRETIG